MISNKRRMFELKSSISALLWTGAICRLDLPKDIGQQKVGSKSHNHFTNLQIMCKTNIRIWDCLYHNCFGIRHQQNTKSQELLSG